jgi:hypothetical protein
MAGFGSFDDEEKRKFAKPSKGDDQWNISADDLVKEIERERKRKGEWT